MDEEERQTKRDRINELVNELANLVETEYDVVVTKYVLLYEVFDHEGDRYPSCIISEGLKCYETMGLLSWGMARENEHIARHERE